jgi:hypothetical protein
MISDTEVAKNISFLMLEIGARLNASVAEIQERCPNDEFTAYRRAVGSVMGEMFVEIMKPLYATHPEITPPELL